MGLFSNFRDRRDERRDERLSRRSARRDQRQENKEMRTENRQGMFKGLLGLGGKALSGGLFGGGDAGYDAKSNNPDDNGNGSTLPPFNPMVLAGVVGAIVLAVVLLKKKGR